MKRFSLILALCLTTGLAFAQESTTPSDTLRQCTVRILDRKEKPVRDVLLNVGTNSRFSTMTDKKGEAILEGISDKDTLFAILPIMGITPVPLDGLDSLLIVVKYNKKATSGSYKVKKLYDPSRTTPVNKIDDVQELLKTRPSRDLAGLLAGLIPGLNISYGPNGLTANIRGIGSINSSTEPIVVVDGVTYDSLAAVNGFLDVHSVKSIKVIKDGGMYGMRGANGVIEITTLGGSERGY